MTKKTVAVLISGRGSNLRSLIQGSRKSDSAYDVRLVISNRPDAGGLNHAKAAGISTQIIDHKEFADRTAFDDAIEVQLTKVSPDYICLAGFMRLFSIEFVTRWHNRLINIHPSLLPAFPGLHVQQQAIDAGVRISGCTVHMVRLAMDSGPILAQAAVPVSADDNADTLAARILEAEHQLYPHVMQMLCSGDMRIEGDQVRMRDFAPAPILFSPAL